MHRRSFLKSGLLFAAAAYASPCRAATEDERGREKIPAFDFAWLKGRARSLSERTYQPAPTALPNALLGLGYDRYQSIRFRPDHSLWSKIPSNFRIQFFHRGEMFQEAVRMYEVVDGGAQEIGYNRAFFDLSKTGLNDVALPKDLGFAGFRVQFHSDWKTDVAAFLGASYFRAIGGDYRQYGLSARALAIDTGLARAEEFPRFSEFYFVRPSANAARLTIYALLDSPSITGAYRFDIIPGATLVMEVDGALYPRKTIERLGVAPLTSMFLFGENDHRMANDWRPEIHDSDGLALLTGGGERLWRPLMNPAGTRVNSYFDDNPRGFGLLQRDRNFDHYQDDGAFYERRPSLWIEPKMGPDGGWGKGAVQLVELAAPDETHDNIVAFWNPAASPKTGQEMLFGYHMYWGTTLPF
ncbi:MAG: glucan biosynthesis protein, partial [Candidatus Binatia bacterium]